MKRHPGRSLLAADRGVHKRPSPAHPQGVELRPRLDALRRGREGDPGGRAPGGHLLPGRGGPGPGRPTTHYW